MIRSSSAEVTPAKVDHEPSGCCAMGLCGSDAAEAARAYSSVPHASSERETGTAIDPQAVVPPPETFFCVTCQRNYPVQKDGGTGYGVDAEGRKHCYQCCADREKASMMLTGRACLYLVADEDHWHYRVTDWPGKLSFKVSFHKSSRHNFGCTRQDVWFTGPDGKNWHGVNIGDSQICHCRRNKN